MTNLGPEFVDPMDAFPVGQPVIGVDVNEVQFVRDLYVVGAISVDTAGTEQSRYYPYRSAEFGGLLFEPIDTREPSNEYLLTPDSYNDRVRNEGPVIRTSFADGNLEDRYAVLLRPNGGQPFAGYILRYDSAPHVRIAEQLPLVQREVPTGLRQFGERRAAIKNNRALAEREQAKRYRRQRASDPLGHTEVLDRMAGLFYGEVTRLQGGPVRIGMPPEARKEHEEED
ncbi:hypothetical protein EKI60_00280 [Candidatus Saccharibacteria bacterium]|nr:MAG: hypothetical protein EKI60_00280 [Candidatus Saccharibacteria bacterium]